MANKPRKGWGTHTRAWRNRTAKQVQENYGLSRRSIREMYNRGTLRPAQPDPVAGAKRRVELTEYFSRKNKPPIETGGPDLRRQVFRMFQHEFGDTVRWSSRSERRLWQNLRRFSSDELRRMIATDPKTWADLAKYQASDIANGNAPEIVMELAWQDSDGNWHNPFWYR